ncbi:MAG: sigma-54 dependent transcriptional regulator [Pseudomonadota bacterium]
MHDSHQILVFDTNLERCATLDKRLRYLDCEPTVVQPDAKLETLIQGDWTAVMLGEISASKSLRQLFVRLAERQRNLPVLYFDQSDEILELVHECDPGHAWPIAAPLRRHQLKSLITRARRYTNLNDERRSRITGASPSVKAVRASIEQVAEHETTVLITGESGTGKELVARTIHDLSDHAEQPFVPVNCGAIQAELLESELFGHDKGAFTGAVSDRKGRIELAAGGTLFLDEIGDMSMPMQVKLLRVLQEKEFTTVGGGRTVKADCRIVAATHRDLPAAIKDGTFRSDLFYRLNVFPVKMPPLRKRVQDLPELLSELMLTHGSENKGPRLSTRALDALGVYAWPGNIRELSNLVERLAILKPTGTVDLEDLPAKYQLGASSQGSAPPSSHRPSLDEFNQAANQLGEGVDLKEILIGVEIRLIRQAMDQTGGTVAKAARLLQLQRTTLVEKLRKYRLNSDATSEF